MRTKRWTMGRTVIKSMWMITSFAANLEAFIWGNGVHVCGYHQKPSSMEYTVFDLTSDGDGALLEWHWVGRVLEYRRIPSIRSSRAYSQRDMLTINHSTQALSKLGLILYALRQNGQFDELVIAVISPPMVHSKAPPYLRGLF
jgi:hypothetical protein